MDMRTRSVIYNYTKPKSAAKDYEDHFSGTLSPAALQTRLEYTTRPGDVVVTFNAQFGAIYEAAENCGRLVFGTECWEHFADAASLTMTSLVGDIPPTVQQQGKTARKLRDIPEYDEEDDPNPASE